MITMRQGLKTAALMVVCLVCAIYTQAQTKHKGWAHNYTAEYCAGTTAGGTAICYYTEINLTPAGNGRYTGTMEIDGWQTMVRANIYAEESGKELIIYYDTPQEDNMGITMDSGTTIVTISTKYVKPAKKKARLTYVAKWGVEMLESELVDKNTKIK